MYDSVSIMDSLLQDDVIVVDRMDGDIGDRIVLDKVMLVGSRAETHIGHPYVANAKVCFSSA